MARARLRDLETKLMSDEIMKIPLPIFVRIGFVEDRRVLKIEWKDDTAFGVAVQKGQGRPPGLWRARRSSYVELNLRRTEGRVPDFPTRSHARWPWLGASRGTL